MSTNLHIIKTVCLDKRAVEAVVDEGEARGVGRVVFSGQRCRQRILEQKVLARHHQTLHVVAAAGKKGKVRLWTTNELGARL